VSFPDLRQYSLFMVKRDDGVPLVYLTFGLIMSGLMTKLYIKPMLDARFRRRRGEGTRPEPIAQVELIGRQRPSDHVDSVPVPAGAGARDEGAD
jgi:hypothetical protein